jgi:hypothetical protein
MVRRQCAQQTPRSDNNLYKYIPVRQNSYRYQVQASVDAHQQEPAPPNCIYNRQQPQPQPQPQQQQQQQPSPHLLPAKATVLVAAKRHS